MRQGKPLSNLLGEALEFYLNEKAGSSPGEGAVARSWAALKLERGALENLLEQASADPDFERVAELRLLRPTDL